jgi:hypothetical protein
MITIEITDPPNRTQRNSTRNPDLRQEGVRSAIQELKRIGEVADSDLYPYIEGEKEKECDLRSRERTLSIEVVDERGRFMHGRLLVHLHSDQHLRPLKCSVHLLHC